jgi:hypothetical protein
MSDNINDVQVRTGGGSLAWNSADPSNFERPNTSNLLEPGTGNSTRAGTAVHRWDSSGFETTSSKYQSVTVGGPQENAGDSVVASARTPWGVKADPYSLKDDYVVSVGGLETTVAVARTMGLIARDPSGRYIDAASASEPNVPEQSMQPAGDAFTSPQDEAVLTDWVGRTSGGNQVRAFLEAMEEGEVHRNTVTALASEAGVSPEAMEATLGRVIGAFEKQAETVIARQGVPVGPFLQWAETNRSGELREAAMQMALSRDTSSLAELAASYTIHATYSDLEGAELGDGVRLLRGDNDLPIVDLGPEGQFSFATAVKAGLIRVS